MRYIKETISHQIEIDKSIFIAILYPLEHQEDVLLCLNDAKLKYPKANHYCHASIFGTTGEHQTASDDGEPSRTAGIPILEVLKHHDVTNILCVVIRYFGGIKLGAGGLVRAYTKAAADGIKLAKFYFKREVPIFKITFDYDKINYMDKYFEKDAEIIDKIYLEQVSYTIILINQNIQRIDDIHHLLLKSENLGIKTIQIDES
ncbi:MAG: YigZ family protein [Acholeplasmataceae bacterium]|nr:YigZ family protein [Acholeplasmataceae bacterium]